MKKAILKIGLLLLLLFVFSACGSNNEASSNEDDEGENENQSDSSEPEYVSFMNDMNNNSERVWLLTRNDSDGNFTKDNKIMSVYKSHNGEVEVISFDEKPILRDIDEIEDDELWDYFLEYAQNDFVENKNNSIEEVEKQIEIVEGDLEDFHSEENSINGRVISAYNETYPDITEEQIEEVINEKLSIYREEIEKIENTNNYEPEIKEIEAFVETDATGNEVINENIKFGNYEYLNEDLGWISPVSDSTSYDFATIPIKGMEILNRIYVGYFEDGRSNALITRWDEDIKEIIFDTPEEENVTEE